VFQSYRRAGVEVLVKTRKYNTNTLDLYIGKRWHLSRWSSWRRAFHSKRFPRRRVCIRDDLMDKIVSPEVPCKCCIYKLTCGYIRRARIFRYVITYGLQAICTRDWRLSSLLYYTLTMTVAAPIPLLYIIKAHKLRRFLCMKRTHVDYRHRILSCSRFRLFVGRARTHIIGTRRYLDSPPCE